MTTTSAAPCPICGNKPQKLFEFKGFSWLICCVRGPKAKFKNSKSKGRDFQYLGFVAELAWNSVLDNPAFVRDFDYWKELEKDADIEIQQHSEPPTFFEAEYLASKKPAP